VVDTRSAAAAGRQARDSKTLDVAVRVGLVAYGIVHLLIAWLALQLAFGTSEGSANSNGAMRQLAEQSYGPVLLWLIAVGFAALAIWQVTEAIWGHTREEGKKRTFKRIGSAGRVVIYASLGYSAAQVAVGDKTGSNKDALTARIMDLPFGRFLVGAVGVAVIAVGVVLARRAIRRSFEKDLKSEATSGDSGTVVVRLGQAGYLAKGVALGVVGALFIWAAATYDAKKAGGLDTALKTLLDQPYGQWILTLVALGIASFGAYCFAWARYADT
jgi:Domain of Unknown Function (DUF1206)